MGPRGGDARESPGFALFPKKRVGGPARRRRSRARRERVRDALERARTARRPGASDRPGGRLCGEPRRPLERWPRGRAVEDAPPPRRCERPPPSAEGAEGGLRCFNYSARREPTANGRSSLFFSPSSARDCATGSTPSRSRARWRRRTRTPRRGRPSAPRRPRGVAPRAGRPLREDGRPGAADPLITTVAPWAIPTTRAGPSSPPRASSPGEQPARGRPPAGRARDESLQARRRVPRPHAFPRPAGTQRRAARVPEPVPGPLRCGARSGHEANAHLARPLPHPSPLRPTGPHARSPTVPRASPKPSPIARAHARANRPRSRSRAPLLPSYPRIHQTKTRASAWRRWRTAPSSPAHGRLPRELRRRLRE